MDKKVGMYREKIADKMNFIYPAIDVLLNKVEEGVINGNTIISSRFNKTLREYLTEMKSKCEETCKIIDDLFSNI